MGTVNSKVETIEKPPKKKARIDKKLKKINVELMDHSFELTLASIEKSKTLLDIITDIPEDKESSTIHLDIHDKSIKIEDLMRVSSYLMSSDDEICESLSQDSMQLRNIISITLYLNSSHILDSIHKHMMDNCNKENALEYYQISEEYNFDVCKEYIYICLCTNFDIWKEDDVFLKSLPREIFRNIIHDGRASTSKGEIGIYRIIKRWFKLNEEDPYGNDDIWSAVRLHHMLFSQKIMDEVKDDGFIPSTVLSNVISDLWSNTIASRSTMKAYIKPEIPSFYRRCYRLGVRNRGSGVCWSFYRGIFGHTIEFHHSDSSLYMTRKFLVNEIVDTSEDVDFTLEVICTCEKTGKIVTRVGPKHCNFAIGKIILLCDAPAVPTYHFYLMIYTTNESTKMTREYYDNESSILDLNDYALGNLGVKIR